MNDILIVPCVGSSRQKFLETCFRIVKSTNFHHLPYFADKMRTKS